jgi:hypothetical protein
MEVIFNATIYAVVYFSSADGSITTPGYGYHYPLPREEQ